MKYHEYKKVIKEGLDEYCRAGGSLLYVALNEIMKEYIYEFDEPLPEDEKKDLIDKAHQAIRKGKDLPKGIYLKKVIFRDQKSG